MAWHGLEIPPAFSTPGRRAPLDIPAAAKTGFRGVFLKLLERTGVPVAALEAGLSTGALLLEGAQGFISTANAMVDPTATAHSLRAKSEDLLREVGALLRQSQSAYAVHQMAGVL